MQDRLRALECDLNYLFTGETNDAIKKRFAEIVEREKKQQPTEKEFDPYYSSSSRNYRSTRFQFVF